jgi:hypothetical protein
VTLLPSMVRRRHQGNALRTWVAGLGRLWCSDNDIRRSIGKTLLVGKCTGNIAVAGLVGIDLLDNRLWHWRSSWRKRPVANANARCTATSCAFGYNFHLVGYCVLGAHVVCVCAWHLAVGRLVVYSLNSRDGNGRGHLRPSRLAFRGIGEVFVARLGCTALELLRPSGKDDVPSSFAPGSSSSTLLRGGASSSGISRMLNVSSLDT